MQPSIFLPLCFSLALFFSCFQSATAAGVPVGAPPVKKTSVKQQQRLLRLENRLQRAKSPALKARLAARAHRLRQAASSPPKDWTLSIIAFSFSLGGFFGIFFSPFAWPALIAGFVIAIIGLIRINKFPDKYGGRGLCIASFAIAGVALLGIILAISSFKAVINF